MTETVWLPAGRKSSPPLYPEGRKWNNLNNLNSWTVTKHSRLSFSHQNLFILKFIRIKIKQQKKLSAMTFDRLWLMIGGFIISPGPRTCTHRPSLAGRSGRPWRYSARRRKGSRRHQRWWLCWRPPGWFQVSQLVLKWGTNDLWESQESRRGCWVSILKCTEKLFRFQASLKNVIFEIKTHYLVLLVSLNSSAHFFLVVALVEPSRR